MRWGLLNILGIPNTNAVKFPSVQVPSTDVNTLDDYREGTWAPILVGASTTTYTAQDGRYVKVDKLVIASFTITINSLGDGSCTHMGGFPFSSAGLQAGTVAYYAGIDSALNFMSMYIESAATSCYFTGNTANTDTVINQINVFKNGATVIGSVTYMSTT